MKFIIFHGSFGSHQNNWFPWLKKKLETLKQKVILPQFPVDDWDEITRKGREANPRNQTIDNWLDFFEKNILPKIKKGEKLCFIGHSLGPLFILHLVNKFNLKLDSAIFVSPFFEIPNNKFWQIDLVNRGRL